MGSLTRVVPLAAAPLDFSLVALGRSLLLRQTVAWERANPPAEVPPKMFDYAGEDAVLAPIRI